MSLTIISVGLTASAFSSEAVDALVNAASIFSLVIQQQCEILQSDPTLAAKKIEYRRSRNALSQRPDRWGDSVFRGGLATMYGTISNALPLLIVAQVAG
jgi:hypothetical protein